MPRQTQFKQEVRDYARQIWAAHQGLKALKAEADALDYGSTLEVTADEPSAAAHLAVVYATNDALATMMAAGHATNIATVL
jgi:uncharacterized protein involved in exopolysaccharide biosynthesis